MSPDVPVKSAGEVMLWVMHHVVGWVCCRGHWCAPLRTLPPDVPMMSLVARMYGCADPCACPSHVGAFPSILPLTQIQSSGTRALVDTDKKFLFIFRP